MASWQHEHETCPRADDVLRAEMSLGTLVDSPTPVNAKSARTGAREQVNQMASYRAALQPRPGPPRDELAGVEGCSGGARYSSQPFSPRRARPIRS